MAKEPLSYVCYNCEQTYVLKVPDRKTFCSRDCSYDFIQKKKRIRNEARVSYTVMLGKKVEPKHWRDYYQKIEDATCRNCGKGFHRSNPGSTRFMCSQVCLDEADASVRRAGRLKRKALERGARVGVCIDPLKVFERDGWKCQLCGTSTPKSKRGTYDNKAPELDHILPISLGGKHDWSNVQCACRKCNSDKGARPKGQMLLFAEV